MNYASSSHNAPPPKPFTTSPLQRSIPTPQHAILLHHYSITRVCYHAEKNIPPPSQGATNSNNCIHKAFRIILTTLVICHLHQTIYSIPPENKNNAPHNTTHHSITQSPPTPINHMYPATLHTSVILMIRLILLTSRQAPHTLLSPFFRRQKTTLVTISQHIHNRSYYLGTEI